MPQADQAAKLRLIADRLKSNRKTARKNTKTRRIAITSGKGGVGKSSFSLNLAVVLTKLNKKVLLIDADINLGNLDILLGLSPKYTLRDVIEGKISITELLMEGPGGFSIIPASSGDLDLLKKSEEVKYKIEKELEQLELNYDFVLVDTGAGIGEEVLEFALNSDEIIVVTTTEPTAFTDAYAIIKVLTSRNSNLDISLLINMVASEAEGEEIFSKIQMVVTHFLQMEITYLGYLLRDATVYRAIQNQQPFYLQNDKAAVSRNLWSIAQKINTAKKSSDTAVEKSLFRNIMEDKVVKL